MRKEIESIFNQVQELRAMPEALCVPTLSHKLKILSADIALLGGTNSLNQPEPLVALLGAFKLALIPLENEAEENKNIAIEKINSVDFIEIVDSEEYWDGKLTAFSQVTSILCGLIKDGE